VGNENKTKHSNQGLFTTEQLKEFIESIIIAVALAAFIIVFIVQSFVVSGSSMKPTLQSGERLFVNKFIYRFQEPERGDIVVLQPKGDPNHRYIKRIMGLPGDELEIINGTLYINDQRIAENYIKESDIETDSYRVYDKEEGQYKIYNTGGPFHVREGHVFVMGDNRNHSTDSRRRKLVGQVSYDDIVGQAFWVYWPITRMRVLDDISYSKLES
jgi:signal peptidase I